MRVLAGALLLVALVALAGCLGGGEVERIEAVVETTHGSFTVELFSDLAPRTVRNFGDLAGEGFYEEQRFHRVVDGFVIQAGDPLTREGDARGAWGSGGPGYTIPDEFACQDGTTVTKHPGSYHHPPDQCSDHGGFHEEARLDRAGVLAMANEGTPGTGGSQFFITLTPQDRLTGYHAVFGIVVDGMGVTEAIGSVDTDCTAQQEEPEDASGGEACRDIPVEDVIIEDVTIHGNLPSVNVQEA